MPATPAPLRRRILAQSGTTFVIADCRTDAPIGRDIAPLARTVRRFDCVTVYETY